MSVSTIHLKSLFKSALTGKDAFDIFSWAYFGHSEEACETGAFVFAGVMLFSFLFKIFFLLWWIWHFFQIFWSFGSFHLVYLLNTYMKLIRPKWLDEMEQTNSEKNQKFLVLNDKCFFYLLTFSSRADMITIYTFNQVRWSLHLVWISWSNAMGYTSKMHE